MSDTYEKMLELVTQLNADAEEISPQDESGRPDDPEDAQVREAETLEMVAKRIADILNASSEADIEGSASSQHYIETGVRLSRDQDNVIRVAALCFLHGNDPAGFDLGKLADALGVDRSDVEALS